ncbi:hypothetical protein UCRPC4_g02682 [Phaeomoniella chlamydospora]|uniref:Uncharacterized protein n=1 Tax=Phaeomoniella chlamydospora TaxID=158046 RepID=A0A0G2ENJ6_PHACM|nr:hypothetical protein UCRPC4_g02682 [Phaeomoniella chlamydospora]
MPLSSPTESVNASIYGPNALSDSWNKVPPRDYGFPTQGLDSPLHQPGEDGDDASSKGVREDADDGPSNYTLQDGSSRGGPAESRRTTPARHMSHATPDLAHVFPEDLLDIVEGDESPGTRGFVDSEREGDVKRNSNAFEYQGASRMRLFPNPKLPSTSAPKPSKFIEHFASLSSEQGHASVKERNMPSAISAADVSSRLGPQLKPHGEDGSKRAVIGAPRSITDGRLSGGSKEGYLHDSVPQRDPKEQSMQDISERAADDVVEETASSIWERALQYSRDERRLGGSRSSFNSLARGPTLRNEGQVGLAQPAKLFTNHGHLATGLVSKQEGSINNRKGSSMQIIDSIRASREGSRSPRTGSINTTSQMQPSRRLDKIPRYTALRTHQFARDDSSWARFPSHTRNERAGNAGPADSVDTRDFSPWSQDFCMVGDHYFDAAKERPAIKGNSKSNSMNFGRRTAKNMWKQWTRLYRSHSSDLRRFRAGHRSSISKGGAVEFPELEIIPGFFGLGHGTSVDGEHEAGSWRLSSRVHMEELGDIETEAKRQRRKGRGRGFNDQLPVREANELSISMDGVMDEFINVDDESETPISKNGPKTWPRRYRQISLNSFDNNFDNYSAWNGISEPIRTKTSPSLVTAESNGRGSENRSRASHNREETSAVSVADQSTELTSANEQHQEDDSYVDMSVHSDAASATSVTRTALSSRDRLNVSIARVLSSTTFSGTGGLRKSGSTTDDFRAMMREEKRSRRHLMKLVDRF